MSSIFRKDSIEGHNLLEDMNARLDNKKLF